MKTASINIQNSKMVCPVCGKQYDKNKIQSFATCCNQPLIIEFDFKHETKDDINSGVQSMWRYQRFLPFVEEQNIITLGEGFTPLHSFEKLSEQFHVNLIWKDEGVNPTGSFKARGISMAVSKAKEFGVRALYNAHSRKCRWCIKRILRKSRYEGHRYHARTYFRTLKRRM